MGRPPAEEKGPCEPGRDALKGKVKGEIKGEATGRKTLPVGGAKIGGCVD